MSITRNHNGSTTLTSLAELGEVLDVRSLPSGPDVSADDRPTQEPHDITANDRLAQAADTTSANDRHGQAADDTSSGSSPTTPPDLPTLIAQMAAVSSGLENAARHDARAREQAAVELAQYESLLAGCQDAQRALTEATRLRALAERLAAEAFTDEARALAAQHAVLARSAELTCIQLLAEHTRAAEELASHPYLARALAERRWLAQEQAAPARRAATDRAERLATGLAAINGALTHNQVDEARTLLEPLVREFPDDADVRSRADTIRWRLRQRLVAPAEDAVRDVVRRPYRDDPRAAVTRLAEVQIDGLPEDLARRVFGLWSNACFSLALQLGLHKPRRHAPATSRGMIFARATPEAPDTVLSSLGLPEWRPGAVVDDPLVLRASRALEPR